MRLLAYHNNAVKALSLRKKAENKINPSPFEPNINQWQARDGTGVLSYVGKITHPVTFH